MPPGFMRGLAGMECGAADTYRCGYRTRIAGTLVRNRLLPAGCVCVLRCCGRLQDWEGWQRARRPGGTPGEEKGAVGSRGGGGREPLILIRHDANVALGHMYARCTHQ